MVYGSNVMKICVKSLLLHVQTNKILNACTIFSTLAESATNIQYFAHFNIGNFEKLFFVLFCLLKLKNCMELIFPFVCFL